MTISDKEILQRIQQEEAPFITARELADEFDMTRQWAHSRLQDLHDEGDIEKKKSGERAVIWWIPDD